MVILEKTSTQLKLRHSPYVLWLIATSWLLGILLMIILITVQFSWLFYLWWIPVFLILNILTAIFLLLFVTRIVICHFDKENYIFILKRKGLMTQQIIWYSLADIWEVKLKSTSWNPDKHPHYRIVVVLKSGQDLCLDFGEFARIEKKLETVNIIRRFLGISPQKLG